ncbi:MAG TPA: hypothetical protein VKZ94_07105, partial [Advenella sp.]|nr:hypothetical protein [Advenella sp.]
MKFLFRYKALHAHTLIALLLGGSASAPIHDAIATERTSNPRLFAPNAGGDRASFRTPEFY